MPSKGLCHRFEDTWILDGVRTPMVDYCATFADVSPTDLGIKVAREVLRRTRVDPSEVNAAIAGSVAPGDFDQFFLACHIGLDAGMPIEVPALLVQRIFGTGLSSSARPRRSNRAPPT